MHRVLRRHLERFAQPRDLAALIDLYESNYFRLLRLAPELDDLTGTTVSRVAGALSLYLSVLERHKYTTVVNLTYTFGSGGSVFLEPNARLYVYHDVRAVEVVSHCRRRRAPRPARPSRMPEVDRKWEMNRFLLKWLRFCTHQGHLFLASTTRQAPEVDRAVRAVASPAQD